jgi:hypothetical protein
LFPARRGDSDAGDRSADGDRSEDSGQPWTATAYSLVLLRDLGVDPRCDQVRRAVTLVRDNCRWEHAGQPFFSGEVEPCINGMVIALGTYFDQDVDRKSTGEVADPAWLQFSFPTRWHYDVLRALEYFRAAGDPPDQRVDEAIQLLRSKQQPDGTWLLENTHPGKVHFALEDGDGRPSRWNTLRALRVLSWYGQSAG